MSTRERAQVLALLRRFGWNASSFQVLEPGFRYFFDRDDACVAYVETDKAWVAAGSPIAAPDRLAATAKHFINAARDRKRRALFFATERRFVELAGLQATLIGEQPTWKPEEWAQKLRTSRSMREQLRRARAKGVRVRLLTTADLTGRTTPMRRAMETLIRTWQRARPMAPMGFLVGVHPFDFVEERRIFVAEGPSGLIGIAALVPIYARNGWFLEDVIRAPDAVNGTIELLVDHAMRQAHTDGATYFTLGLAPLAGKVDSWLRIARSVGRELYDFSGLRAFKAKFLPAEWVPIYLSYPKEHAAQVVVYDSLVAFSRGSLLRFGWDTLAQRSASLARKGARIRGIRY